MSSDTAFRVSFRWLAVLAVLLSYASVAFSVQSSCESGPVALGNNTITFERVRYDFPSVGQSTWYYCVESGGAPAISHVLFALSNCDVGDDILDAGTWDGTDKDILMSGGGTPDPTPPGEPTFDPTTGKTGLKFDLGFSRNEIRYYYFTLAGNFAAEDSVCVATKSGPDIDTALICGPSPDCIEIGGACCLPDGSCVVLTEKECGAQGGDYQGDGTDCDPNPCDQPEGACCFSDGSCVVLSEADCVAQGGVYQGDGTDCDPNPCGPPDNEPPVCFLQELIPGPPTQVLINIQDFESGTCEINVISMSNVTVNIPGFVPGTTERLIVVGTKVDQSLPSQIVLQILDCQGNETICDPVITELGGGHFGVVTDTYTGIPEHERYITFLNGTPGFNIVSISVNGIMFEVSLQDGMQEVLDVESAMLRGLDNTMTFTYWSYTPGCTAAVLIADSPGIEGTPQNGLDR